MNKSNKHIKDWINNYNNNKNNKNNTGIKENLGFNMRKDSYIDTLEYNETTSKSNKLNDINPYIVLPEIKNNNFNMVNYIKKIDNVNDNKYNKLPKIKN